MSKYNFDEIFGFETDTVWGIGCHPLSETAVDRIYELKGRDKDKPLILMSSKFEYLKPYIKTIPDYAAVLIKKYFPGGLTLIFEKSEICPYFITSNKETVGIRIPNHKGFQNLADEIEGKVLATTSLNLSNCPPVQNYDEAKEKFSNTITLIKPDGSSPPPRGTASTVVLCTNETPLVLRQGEIFI